MGQEDYCKCDKPNEEIYEHDEFRYWFRCGNCNKIIESSFAYDNDDEEYYSKLLDD